MRTVTYESSKNIPWMTKDDQTGSNLKYNSPKDEPIGSGTGKLEERKEIEQNKDSIDALFKLIHELKKKIDELHQKIEDK